MTFDIQTVRLLSRLTDRMDLIRKHPYRYEVDPNDLPELTDAAQRLEQQLARVKVLTAT